MNTTTTRPTDRTESERHRALTDALREWGFSVFQVHLLHDALKEAGLRLEVDPKRK